MMTINKGVKVNMPASSLTHHVNQSDHMTTGEMIWVRMSVTAAIDGEMNELRAVSPIK